MAYQVIPASVVAKQRNSYPALDWPTDQLAVGDAFIVPLHNGADADGRSEAYLRVIADKIGRRSGRKFRCNKVDDGLAVSRIA